MPPSGPGTGVQDARTSTAVVAGRPDRPPNPREEERETVPLLEHIAEQAVKLLRCERASIFLWDQTRKELVGRPALGLPNGELRLKVNSS